MNSISSSLPRKRGLCGFRYLFRSMLDVSRPLFYFLLAGVLTFAVEWLSRWSPAEVLAFMWEHPLAYLTNYGIILLTILPALLFRKRLAGTALLCTLWVALGIAQCLILMTRITPFSATDIAIALSVISIIPTYLTPFQIALIILAIAAAVVGIVALFVRASRLKVRFLQFLAIYGAALMATILVISAGYATGQLSDHFPNLATAYNDYGFPYCFGMSIVDQGVDRPDEYGEELITDILGELPSTPVEPPAVDQPAERAPNIIVVQLESFFDVKYLEGVTYTSDPLPTFTALKEQYPSGVFHVPVISAGTVNTEFEVLTGMSIADFGAGEYPYRTVMLDTTCETIAYDLLASGYRTHAIHNHEGSFYMRNDVYKNLGFESFTSIEYFEDPTYNENNWAHDALLTDEILYMLKDTEESDFVFAVSVQGHGKYPDVYTPAEDDILIADGTMPDTTRSHFNYYINQLNEMDAFIRSLYEAVMAMEEDTLLVLYGDHLPGIVRDEGIVLSTGEFETEYIMIANYETPGQAPAGALSSYQLFPAILELVGNDQGVMNQFHRTYRDDPQYLSLLAALEYDILYGRRMAYGDTIYPVMENMKMGSRTIAVEGYSFDGSYVYVKGENFTPYSTVTLDGREEKTEFIDKQTLRIISDDPVRLLTRTEEITIRQVSRTGECLSETPAYPVSFRQGVGNSGTEFRP